MENKKYKIYLLIGDNGYYESKYIETVDNLEQAEDRVAELRAENQCNAYYEEVEDKKIINKIYECLECGYQFWEEDVIVSDIDNVPSCPNCGCGDVAVYIVDEDGNEILEEKMAKTYISPEFLKADWEKLQKDPMISAKEHWSDAYYQEVLEYGKEKEVETKKPEIGNVILIYRDGSKKEINSKDISKEDLSNVESIQDQCNLIMDIEDYNRLSKEYPEASYLELVDINLNESKNLNEECSQASGVASGVNGKIDSFPINPKEMEKQRLKESEDEDDSLFEALKELINYLNKNTKYNWDANEIYDNCAITESDTDYIEVFVDIKDGNKIYTVDNYSYNSLEELVKNMPVLFTDEDENYDYDEGWEDEEEYQADKELDQKKTDKFNSEGPASFEHLKNLGIFDKKESKDVTQILQEMSSLEDYDDSSKNDFKKIFIHFCKDKIEDMDNIEIDEVIYKKIMHTEGIKEFEDLYIIADFDDPDFDRLIAIDKDNNVVINTNMIDYIQYASEMQFDKIDRELYNNILRYWDDLDMNEYFGE